MLGNPPYVAMGLFKDLKGYLKKRYEVVADRADLSAYFFERGIKCLKPGGRLGYVSSSTFFKTGSGKPLRQFLAEALTIENLVDFGDVQNFRRGSDLANDSDGEGCKIHRKALVPVLASYRSAARKL